MKLFRVVCLLCGLASSSFAIDREAFTITKYDLEIRLEPVQQRLGARGKITLRNDSTQPQKVATLQITSTLSWRSIKAEGKPVQFVSQPYVSDIDHTGALSEALVTLPAEVKPKEAVELEISYEGTIPLDATRMTQIGVPDELAKHASWDQISPSFTAVRGAGYVAWYPIATESADFSEGNSLFEVVDRWKAREARSEFKAILGLVGANDAGAPMLLCSGEGGASYSFESSRNHILRTDCEWKPLGLATPTFVAAYYETESKPPASLFGLADHKAGAAKYTGAFEPATKFVTEWFGQPSTPIAIADLADPHAASFESGTLLLVSMAAEDAKLAEINVVHEVVHSAISSARPWVYEGLAHFAGALDREKQDGRQAALDFLGLHREALVDLEKDVVASPQKSPSQPLATTFDETYYRSKAAYVWWMLRDMIGDEALKQAIHQYRAGDDKDPKYVEQLVGAAAKRDLGWFFTDWVYQDHGLPDFHVQSVHPWKNEKGEQLVTVTIENLGNVGAEVPFTVRFQGGEVTRRLEVRAKSTATTRVELPGAPTEIVINDGSVPESDLANNTFKIAAP